jgi:HSP20 family molecular chaperone IbpA
VLRGDLPGVRKDDINVSIDGDTVAITPPRSRTRRK